MGIKILTYLTGVLGGRLFGVDRQLEKTSQVLLGVTFQ